MISVITTTYNCAAYISQAIRSILNQTFKDFEYLIIDDGSTDNTEEIVRTFIDKRIRFFKYEHVGRSTSLNIALELANYEIIALMDADDISHPSRFEKQLELFLSREQFIFCDTAYFKSNTVKYVIKSSSNSHELKKRLALHGPFNNSSSIFNRNHIIANGGFNEKLSAYEDYDLWLRLMDKSKFIVSPGIYHYVRLRRDSMTTSNPSKLKHLLYQLQNSYYENLPDQFDIVDQNEQNLLKGWREFFYGNKTLARRYWSKVNISKRGKKVISAAILSYFPSTLLELIKNNRLRLRYEYWFNYMFSSNKIQKEFEVVLSKLLVKGLN